MSLDSSLKTGGGLTKHRNVLTRAERIEILAGSNRFNVDGDDPLGLPKVGNRKIVTGGKAKKAAAEGAEVVEGGEATEGAAPEGDAASQS